MERYLVKTFEKLHQSQIRYGVLRGMDGLDTFFSIKEIDVLVADEDIKNFERVLGEIGYVVLPSWGFYPHRFYVAYDKENDTWLKLDVVTRLVYGKPIRHLNVPLHDQCLNHLRMEKDLSALALEHEFITLLLHCLLDKGAFDEKHRKRLAAICADTQSNQMLNNAITHLVQTTFAGTLAWQELKKFIDNKNWRVLLSFRRKLSRRLFWASPFLSSWLFVSTFIHRRLRPFYFVVFRPGLSVALLAPDGAGKSTLSRALAEQKILRAKLIYMGSNYDSATVSLPTSRWLKRKAKAAKAGQQNVLSILFRAMNYLNRLLEQWLRYFIGFVSKLTGKLVIFDRYSYDSYLAPPAKTIGKKTRRWLLRSTCPAPDMVILLDAPGEVLFNRKGEHSAEILEKQRQTFLSLQDRIEKMYVINATENAKTVRKNVISLIWNYYGNLVSRNGKH